MFFHKSKPIDDIGGEVVRATLDQFVTHGLAADKFALTLLLHPPDGRRAFGKDASLPTGYSYRGDVVFYPCSVIKVFHLVATQSAFETGRVSETPELERAMHDMIKWSSNTATNYIIDILTETTGDTDLTPEEMPPWIAARNTINAYFQGLNLPELKDINVSQKLMDDDRYGREKKFVQLGGNNHNRLTTEAVASMLARIMDGAMVSPKRSQIMADFLHRPREASFVRTPSAQVLNYLGADLPQEAKLWSKAGWTGWTRDPLASYHRHDAVHVALPNRRRFTLVAFTQGEQISADMTVLPFVGKRAAELIAAL